MKQYGLHKNKYNVQYYNLDMSYAINQKRLEYLEKTIKLVDIAARIDEKLENNEA